MQRLDSGLPSPPSPTCSWDDRERESKDWIAAVDKHLPWERRGGKASGTWVKSLPCPTCTHWMSVVFDGGLVLPAVEAPDEMKVMAFCNCAVEHDGHPLSDDSELYRRGCGRWGLVKPPEAWEVPKDVTKWGWRRYWYWARHPVRLFEKGLLEARQPISWGKDPTDRSWEVEALGSRAALTEIRQTAEKWSQSIAAILGVFTIVAFVKGPDKFEAIHNGTAVAAGALMLLALVLGGGGIWLGALAAQATPWKKTRLTGWELNKFYAHQTWKAAKYLKWSRWLVFGAAVFVLAAVCVVWVASIPNPPSNPK